MSLVHTVKQLFVVSQIVGCPIIPLWLVLVESVSNYKSFVWCCTKFKISKKFYFGLLTFNIQIKVGECGQQRFCSNAVLCVSFT